MLRTKETLATGNLLSVINVLMQLRKVCNHPNLFEPRPIVSPFQMEGIVYQTASQVWGLLDYDPFKVCCAAQVDGDRILNGDVVAFVLQHVNLYTLNLLLADLELTLTAYSAHRMRKFQANPVLIQEIDKAPPLPPPCPRGKLHLHVTTTQKVPSVNPAATTGIVRPLVSTEAVARPGVVSALGSEGGVAAPQQPRLAAPAPTLSPASATVAASGAATRPPVQVHLVQQSGTLHAVSVHQGEAVARDRIGDKIHPSGERRLSSSSAGLQNSNQDGTGET